MHRPLVVIVISAAISSTAHQRVLGDQKNELTRKQVVFSGVRIAYNERLTSQVLILS